MKNLLFTASLLLLALGGNDSLLQANIPSLLPTARAAEQEESSLEKKGDRQPLFIWKCKKEDQTVYLLGAYMWPKQISIHCRRRWKMPSMRAAFSL